jgi:hypothetical protein
MADVVVETENSFYLVEGLRELKDGETLSLIKLQTKINCGSLVSIFTQPKHYGSSWRQGEKGEFVFLDKKGKVVLKTTRIQRIFSYKKQRKRQKDEQDLL